MNKSSKILVSNSIYHSYKVIRLVPNFITDYDIFLFHRNFEKINNFLYQKIDIDSIIEKTEVFLNKKSSEFDFSYNFNNFYLNIKSYDYLLWSYDEVFDLNMNVINNFEYDLNIYTYEKILNKYSKYIDTIINYL